MFLVYHSHVADAPHSKLTLTSNPSALAFLTSGTNEQRFPVPLRPNMTMVDEPTMALISAAISLAVNRSDVHPMLGRSFCRMWGLAELCPSPSDASSMAPAEVGKKLLT
jgi:hypothetical protein